MAKIPNIRRLWCALLSALLPALLSALWLALPAAAAQVEKADGMTRPAPIIIAHRGASGERPEHTLAAYQLAIDQGADYIEPDLVLTKDGVLVARHENEISETTNVADFADFADRKTSKIIDGVRFTGWFTEDFTLDELKRLTGRERLPQLRTANTAYDGQFAVPTFAEILALVRANEARLGRTIGVYPETKHPSYFNVIGLPHLPPLLAVLAEHGYGRALDEALYVQSFEVGNLQAMAAMGLPIKRIQLVADDGGPIDRPGTRYADMITPDGLAGVARYAHGIGPAKALVIPRDGEGRLLAPTALVTNAHAAGLKVHIWTMRRENFFLPSEYRSSADPRAPGDLTAEVRAFIAAGVDGLFSDNVPEAVAAIPAPPR